MYLIETLGSVHVKIDVWTRPKMTTTKLTTKAQFRRRTSAEPNQIQRIKFMRSAASESIRNGWFNLI